ncbi:MAG: serine hydrolase domain-containing protein [Candidatus Binatia bacterium]
MPLHDPREAGFDPDRLERLAGAIQHDIDADLYDGCEIVVARGGHVAFHRQFGFADRATKRPVEPAQPFITMSIAKQLTVAAVFQRIERGDFALSTRVAELIPEFGQRGKDRVTIAHLLTHTGGLPMMLPPMPAELAGNLDAVVQATCASLLEFRPGSRVSYCVLVAHAVLAECVRRADGGRRPYRHILAEDLFGPLGMKDTTLGCPERVKPRLAPVVARDRRPGLFDPAFLEGIGGTLAEDTEIPAGGCVSTAPDIHRFAEMLRRGGELDGVRILSPATVEAIQVNQTGDEPNSLWAYTEAVRGWEPFPANLGLGFFLRGEGIFPAPFGQLASPSTFGGFGAGSTAFWIDPASDVTYAFLSSGLMEDSYSLERHMRLADLVHAARI